MYRTDKGAFGTLRNCCTPPERAVTKFLDIQDLGNDAPRRIAVVTKRKETPHLPVLALTAEIVFLV